MPAEHQQQVRRMLGQLAKGHSCQDKTRVRPSKFTSSSREGTPPSSPAPTLATLSGGEGSMGRLVQQHWHARCSCCGCPPLSKVAIPHLQRTAYDARC
eukprot:1157539-Pelagomonas_calceolata.AAC.8